MPTNGAKIQYSNPEDTSKLLPPSETTHPKQVIGTLLYYTIELDNNMTIAIGYLASVQIKTTKNISEEITHLLSYADTHPNVKIRCHRSVMITHIHSDG